jgi:hypothetical protein
MGVGCSKSNSTGASVNNVIFQKPAAMSTHTATQFGVSRTVVISAPHADWNSAAEVEAP